MSNLILLRPEKYDQTDWQREDIDYLTKLKWSANWSEMGCYKTTTGLWLLQNKTEGVENPHSLIVTTKAGKGTYYDAIPKTLEGTRIYNLSTKGVEIIGPAGITLKIDPDEYVAFLQNPDRPAISLAHYHCFTNRAPIKELLWRVMWDFILIDEAHRIKNRDAQWTRNIKQLNARDGLKHIMTGTGFINDPSEVWSLLNFLEPKKFSSYWKFRRTFCEEAIIGGFTKVVGIKPEMREHFIQLRKDVGVRRMMADVHKDVKHPIFTPIEVDLNPTQRRMYDEIKRYLQTLDQQGEPVTSPNVLSQLNRLRQVCVATPEVVKTYYDPIQDRRIQEIKLIEPSSKLDAFMELLDGLEWDEENRQQVVVFSTFKDPLALLEKRLEANKIPYLRLRENMNEQQRYQLWHDIWPKKEHRVFLTTLQLGSESINLTSAQYGVFLDRSWSPKDNNQGVGRLYRPGQKHVPNIIHINANKTIDQRMEKLHNTKTGWFKVVFGD